jgi:hypothetical protein
MGEPLSHLIIEMDLEKIILEKMIRELKATLTRRIIF